MHGEISKRPFGAKQERKHYQSVNMQMGRVQLDADWNEAFEILLKADSRAFTDIIGRHGSPNDGFRIDNVLILDHLESQTGWSVSSGTGTWNIEHFDKVEGRGSFKIHGDVRLTRELPELLKSLSVLQTILIERLEEQDKDISVGIPTPKLHLHYKVSALEDAQIQLAIGKEGGAEPVPPDVGSTYPCDGWQIITFDISGVTLSDYKTLFLRVSTSGTVYLDCLALDPGLLNPEDFYIQGGDGTSDGAGRYYVDGLACIKEGFETYFTQKDYPEAPGIGLDEGITKLIYLDAWKRTITSVEDPNLLEVALDGPDTCTREQLVAQVKVLNVLNASECETDIEAIKRPSPIGKLTAKLASRSEEAECDFKPELDYTGLNNSLYRIEIHEGGDFNSATFKWSRNNGADLVLVRSFDNDGSSVIVPDDRLLCCGDLVELCDDVSDLADFSDASKHGKLAHITTITHQSDGVKITLDLATTPFKSRVDSNGSPTRHPKLRKWHGDGRVKSVDANGVPKKDQEIEHGIRLAFSEGNYYRADYWQFTARVNGRVIEELDQALPMGPVHHYAPLSIIRDREDNVSFTSCRNVFPPLTDLEANDIAFDPAFCHTMTELGVENVQQAIEVLCRYARCCDELVLPGQSIQEAINRINPEGGSVCLTAGIHVVTETVLIKDRQNLIIRGVGSATRVIYLPKEPEVDHDLIEELQKKLQENNDQIEQAAGDDDEVAKLKAERRELLRQWYIARGKSEEEAEIIIRISEIEEELQQLENDLEKKEELENRRYELYRELARIYNNQLYDLFRTESSENIRFENFLMVSPEADSLIAIVNASQNVMVERCDMIALPMLRIRRDKSRDRIKGTIKGDRSEHFFVETQIERELSSRTDPIKVIDNVINQRTPVSESERWYSCIRLTDCCDVTVSNNRLAGKIGVAQLEGYVEAIPLISGLTCSKNQCKVILFGIYLIEGQKVVIKENEILSIYIGLTEDDYETLEILRKMSLRPEHQCILQIHQQINDIVDELLSLFFQCSPPLQADAISEVCGVAAFILRMSRIEGNRFAGGEKPQGFTGGGVDIFYSECNNILGNQFAYQPPALRLIYNFCTTISGNTFESLKPGAEERVQIRLENAIEAIKPAVEHHFSDQMHFVDNKIEAVSGLMLSEMSPPEFVQILRLFAPGHPVEHTWNAFGQQDVMVLLAKRFSDLMGLKPTINLLETIFELFSHKEEDWVEYLVQKWSWGSDDDENYFVTLLVNAFATLLKLKLISRSTITNNRFEVTSSGIEMVDGGTLGGVRIMSNRISGANETAILWKAWFPFANPELFGMALNCVYQILLDGLIWLQNFLAQLLEGLEGEDDQKVSPIRVFLAMSTLYGIGQVCPERTVEMDVSSDAEPLESENPFAPAIRKVLNALKELFLQLQHETVKNTLSDLASSDDRIGWNQIRGRGTGIHTNITNSVIESNRIDVEAGQSSIAGLFAAGRYLVTHADVLKEGKDEHGNRIDHSAVVSLGHALMNLNPYALDTSKNFLSENIEQWLGLGDVLGEIGQKIPLSREINTTIRALATEIVREEPSIEKSNILLDAFKKHLVGYGMILESPGMQVIKNRIEAVGGCEILSKENTGISRQAPGGILMTSSSDSVIYYVFLMVEEEEEILAPFNSDVPVFNMGGQGTLFSGNSLQWGTGYGLSLSALPIMIDVKIENNEIQNHGLAGILCDKTIIPEIPEIPVFKLYKLKIAENEINHCFRNTAYMLSWGTPLGGLMVRNTEGVDCFHNNVRFCGKTKGSWPAYGTLFIKSSNVKYEGNTILANGRETSREVIDPEGDYVGTIAPEADSPKGGGALFLRCSGNLSIINNRFMSNIETTLLIYSDPPRQYTSYDKIRSLVLDKLLVLGNIFEIDDRSVDFFAKITIGSPKGLNFSQNQVSLLNEYKAQWKGIHLEAENNLIFNGNIVTGHKELPTVVIIIVTGDDGRHDHDVIYKYIAIGNVLYKALGPSIVQDHNIIIE